MDSQVSDSPFDSFIQNNKLVIILFLIGILLIGFGFLGMKIFQFSSTGPKVEILGSETVGPASAEASAGKGIGNNITVEASGEVMKPGVYELEVGSRINDLLIASGGLSANADREWVAKNINQAQKLIDGAKIYIPKQETVNGVVVSSKQQVVREEKININTASESELDTLVGVGPVTAKKIIDGRPYQIIEDLLNKKIVNKSTWEKIKEQVSVY